MLFSKFLINFIRKDKSLPFVDLGSVLMHSEFIRFVLDACGTLKRKALQDAGIASAFLIFLTLCGHSCEISWVLRRFPRRAEALKGVFEANRPYLGGFESEAREHRVVLLLSLKSKTKPLPPNGFIRSLIVSLYWKASLFDRNPRRLSISNIMISLTSDSPFQEETYVLSNNKLKINVWQCDSILTMSLSILCRWDAVDHFILVQTLSTLDIWSL